MGKLLHGLLALALVFLAAPTFAAAPTADEIIEANRRATYYAGKDLRSKVLFEIFDKNGKKRIREVTWVRRTPEPGGDYKIFIYFHQPDDVKRMAMIIWVYPNRADDRWVYVPAIDSIRRIAAMDEREKFVGTDFTYEDGSGHDVNAHTNRFLPEEKMNNRECWVVESIPKKPDRYSKRVFWIDKKTLLALRYDYYDLKNRLWKTGKSEAMQMIKVGDKVYPTHVKISMTDHLSGGHSFGWYKDIEYDKGVDDADFNEANLRTPPSKWIR